MKIIKRWKRVPLLLALCVAGGIGCTDTPSGTDDTGGGGGGNTVDPAGVWNFHFVNTTATGVCSDENGEASDETITITKSTSSSGYNVVAKGFEGSASKQLTGTFISNALNISGSYAEGTGTTTSHHTLTATDASHMSGIEDWSWSGPGGTCPGSRATVTAVRVP